MSPECPTKCPMSLHELLDSVGLTKTELAKLMSVSRKTIARMGDEVSDDVLKTIDKYRLTDQASQSIPTPEINQAPTPTGKRVKEPDDYTPKEIKQLCLRRGTQSDYDISQSIGIQVHEFRQMIVRLVSYCKTNQCTSASLV